MERASEALFALKPVTFRYKKELDPKVTPQFGLVAEDVERIDPDLVVRDRKGKPYTVRYDAVNAMLLNEFLKEHRKVEELEAALEAVNARLNEHESRIATANAQLKLSTTPPRTTESPQRVICRDCIPVADAYTK